MRNAPKKIRAGLGRVFHRIGLKRLALAVTVYNPLIVYWNSVMLRRRYADIQIGILLWPPARAQWDTIQSELALEGEIIQSREISIAPDQFREFVEAVYAIDTTRSPKADNKYRHLLSDDLTVRLILLRIENPHVFTKDIFQTMIWCREIKDIKDQVRARHRNSVPDYTYDTIIHSTDNDLQTNELVSRLKRYVRAPEEQEVP